MDTWPNVKDVGGLEYPTFDEGLLGTIYRRSAGQIVYVKVWKIVVFGLALMALIVMGTDLTNKPLSSILVPTICVGAFFCVLLPVYVLLMRSPNMPWARSWLGRREQWRRFNGASRNGIGIPANGDQEMQVPAH